MEDRGKILIVDDKAENLFALENVLRPLDVEVVKATSGNEALKATLKHEFALAIIDILMPGMDGYELVRLLRGQEETKAMPVIFLTAILPDEEHFSRGYESGAVDYLNKPVNQEILLAKVRVFLELDHNRRELLLQKAALESLVHKLENSNKRLEGEIATRLRMEEELLRAKEESEAASEAKSQFLANMSHEIRTPMNGVIGMIELIAANRYAPEATGYLRMAKQSAQNLLAIINDILDFSRIEAGRMEIRASEFGVRRTIAGVAATMELAAREKHLTLEWSVGERVPVSLMGDEDRLRQILLNLVGNAVKFTARGGIAIMVDLAANEQCLTGQPKPVCLVFTVADTGIGIAADKRELIFDSFTQAEPSLVASYGGSGLGLAISKRLVEMMGGAIWVDSEPGRGSTFFFTVALDTPREAGKHGEDDLAEADGPGRRALRILLAEDNPINQVLGVTLLMNRGHEVIAVANGREAIEALKAEPFDVVLMDIRMPEMNGEEAVGIIKHSPPPGVSPVIPVVAVTAHAMQGDRERFLAKGFDDYVSKPIDMDELDRVLERVLEVRNASRTPQ